MIKIGNQIADSPFFAQNDKNEKSKKSSKKTQKYVRKHINRLYLKCVKKNKKTRYRSLFKNKDWFQICLEQKFDYLKSEGK